MFNREEMLPLIEELNRATEAYDRGESYISDLEWDRMYFQLTELERKCNFAYPHSPTQTIHYTIVNALEKVAHSHPMLSLEKTKDEEEIKKFMSKGETVTMLKMDGLTCSLTYEDGKLVSAETRGNGTVGEQVIHNAMMIPSIPKTVARLGTVTVDGEIICNKREFEENWDGTFANPRNFAAGSIRLLDSKECAERHLTFVAWDWIDGGHKTLSEKLTALGDLNFTVVPFVVDYFNPDILNIIAEERGYPIDGLVVKYNDCDYYNSLGNTTHHFRGGLAFKYADDSVVSYLKDIDYEVSRNGVLTPVAVFEEVELEGSTISRASLHNLTIAKSLLGDPYIGQEIEVVKQNMIIPQIISSVKRTDVEKNKMIDFPETCPSCGEPLEIICENDSEVLVCNNTGCSCRIINKLDYYCSKKGLDIRGLSKARLEKLLNWGWINCIEDLYKLSEHRDEWCAKPGFGPKSVDSILAAIETSKTCELANFITALGIPLVGTTVAKDIVNIFHTWEDFIDAIENNFDFYSLQGFGVEKHKTLHRFNYEEAKTIADKYITFIEPKETITAESSGISMEGLTFVITGKLTHFKNRTELEEKITALGGKVTGSVSKKTNYLINNDKDSDSAKNKAAKAAGIPIISEEDFLQTFGII